MTALKSRVKALESAHPAKPWFTIEVQDKPTAEEWELINAAHAERRMVYVFRFLGNTLGLWMSCATEIVWSDDEP